MRIILVGADYEENLGLGMVAAAAVAAGHRVQVLRFNEAAELTALARGIARADPAVVGLSIQFQHRSLEFLTLARRLRQEGYRGHLTCGGQHPSMAHAEILADSFGVDSVVLFDGEETFVELLAALAQGTALEAVPGLALRQDGAPGCTAPRPLPDDLDRLPFPHRYRAHTRHLGIPFIPIMGSRGCWGSCRFCAITSFYRAAHARGGGRRLRWRSPASIAEEMARLTRAVGGPAIFCFHDDTFLLPREADSLRRLEAIRRELDARGVGEVGLIGKCRPDGLSPRLARRLRELGVIRLYVGVENVSQHGSDDLGRRVQVDQVHRALAACQEAGIFGCYNLLLFEPDATLADVEKNLAFIREHPAHPVNFCRAEPYHGTPLQQGLAREGRLTGSYLGYDYRIADDAVELLFRVCAAAFRERNFAPQGVHNRTMGLGYQASVLERFYDDPLAIAAAAREAEALTRAITRETTDFLAEAIAMVRRAGPACTMDRDQVERETALLALRIAEADRLQHARLDQVSALLDGVARHAARERPAAPPRRFHLARRVAQGLSLGLLAVGAGCESRTPVVDPAVRDSGVPREAGQDVTVVDCVPWDAGVDVPVSDPPPPDAGRDRQSVEFPWYDPLPADLGVDGPPLSDPAPSPEMGGPVDWIPGDASVELDPHLGTEPAGGPRRDAPTGDPIDRWRDSGPRQALRTADLPFHDPPRVALAATRTTAGIQVTLCGGPAAVSLRWEAEGEIVGDGREVLWVPGADTDQLRVGVRAAGGVAVVSLRLKDVAPA